MSTEKRNERILKDYMRHMTYKAMSEKYGLCTAQIYNILATTGARRRAA
jgi:Mor family transcriptional regulator